MAKNLRITKANQAAVNLILEARTNMKNWESSLEYAKKEGDKDRIKRYQRWYNDAASTWDAYSDMLAKMHGMDWVDMVKSEGYKAMVEIAESK